MGYNSVAGNVGLSSFV